ncbi:MAG: DUF4390 domain-containing protein [Thermodesulfobacteriota bacterium]
MTFFYKKRLIIIIVFFFSFTAYAYAEKDAEIANMMVSKSADEYYLSFSVKNAFSEDIDKLISSGIPVTFSFDIVIVKKRFFFPDKTIYENELKHKLKYSSLTKTYFIKKPYISEDPYIINSEDRAKSEMSSITDFSFDSFSPEQGSEYEIRARARLQEITLPFYLHRIFFFLSAWDFKTDWHKLSLDF